MSFSRDEHRSMLDRAHAAVDQRDRTRRTSSRTVAGIAIACAVAAVSWTWWPRAAPPIVVAKDKHNPPAEQWRTPSWLTIITSDEEIEEGFAAAGQCAHVVHVDNRIMTVACSDLSGAPESRDSEPNIEQ